MAEDNEKALGEVRSNTQVITRIFLVVVILVVVGGFLLALFRRPARVLDEALITPAVLPAVAKLLQV